jgi:hypothetical protein
MATVVRVLPGDWGDKARIALYWVASLFSAGYLLTWRNRRRKAGAVLMRMRRDRASLIGSIAGFFAAVITFAQVLSQTGEAVLLLSEGTFFLCMGGYLFHMWYEGRQLRENGVVAYGAFFRWNKIRAYDWKGEILSLSLIRRWPFSRVPLHLRVSPDQKETVKQIIGERIRGEP